MCAGLAGGLKMVEVSAMCVGRAQALGDENDAAVQPAAGPPWRSTRGVFLRMLGELVDQNAGDENAGGENSTPNKRRRHSTGSCRASRSPLRDAVSPLQAMMVLLPGSPAA